MNPIDHKASRNPKPAAPKPAPRPRHVPLNDLAARYPGLLRACCLAPFHPLPYRLVVHPDIPISSRWDARYGRNYDRAQTRRYCVCLSLFPFPFSSVPHPPPPLTNARKKKPTKDVTTPDSVVRALVGTQIHIYTYISGTRGKCNCAGPRRKMDGRYAVLLF